MDFPRHPTAASSTLVELTTRLDFFKERRSQLMEQLHSLDLNYGAAPSQDFAYRPSSPPWSWFQHSFTNFVHCQNCQRHLSPHLYILAYSVAYSNGPVIFPVLFKHTNLLFYPLWYFLESRNSFAFYLPSGVVGVVCDSWWGVLPFAVPFSHLLRPSSFDSV